MPIPGMPAGPMGGAAPAGFPPQPGAGGPGGAGGGTGPAAAPGGHMGGQAMAMTALQVALEAMQKALPGLPMGGELHTEVLRAVTSLSKKVAEAGAANDQQAKIQQLIGMARSAQQAPAMARAAQGFGGGAGGGPAGPMAAMGA